MAGSGTSWWTRKSLIIAVKVTPADVSDRDAARELLPALGREHPELTLIWADNAYTGLSQWTRDHLNLTLKVVKETLTRWASKSSRDDGSSKGHCPG
jgi:hypothetical protein